MAQQKFIGNLRQSPAWLKDFGGREHIIAFPGKLVASAFTDAFGVNVTTTAGASQNDTTLAVTALTPSSALWNTIVISTGNVLIPSGTVLYFGGAKVATLTADAAIGDTSLTVAAIPTAISSGDSATYSVYGTVAVAAGTPVGRTYAERDANTGFGPAALTDDEIYLTVFDVPDVRVANDVELVRHNSLIAENYLPNYTSLSGEATQTVTISGSPTGGTFTLTYKGYTTTPLAYNISTANMQTALQALTSIGSSNVTVSGSAGTSYVLNPAGTLDGTTMDLLTADGGALTGGTPAINVAYTTATTGAMLNKLRSLYTFIKGAQ